MRTIDLIAHGLRQAGTRYLFCFPTSILIEACAQAGLKPMVCRQERVGVGMADGYSRVTSGSSPGVFAMQYGPGAENAYAGIATAFSDSVPILLLPLGHPVDRQGVAPLFTARDGFRPVSKSVEVITSPARTLDALRRAYAALRSGRLGPVVVEVPADVAVQEATSDAKTWPSIPRTVSCGDPADVLAAAQALCAARRPVVLAGQGVLYARASDQLVALAELLSLPVATSLLGKSAFPETHALALGCASQVTSAPAAEFLRRADLILAVGSSLTRHATKVPLPPDVPIVHVTNDPTDLHKDYFARHAILGDARLVLDQFIEACRDIVGPVGRANDAVAAEIAAIDRRWRAAWSAKASDAGQPINPYRVIHEFSQTFDPNECIVTHDSGNPRGQLVPFYRCGGPRSFLGWGMSHGLGSSLGLTMGAKLACPEKLCVNFMGDAAFGMVGMDFETAVRHEIPILTLVLNNSGMASEVRDMPFAEAEYGASNLGGDYAAIARALGGHAERVVDPNEIRPGIDPGGEHHVPGKASAGRVRHRARDDAFDQRQARATRVIVDIPHDLTVSDLENAARETLPPDLYEFIATGARDEQTVRANAAAWRAWWFVPRVCVDVSSVATTTWVLGQSIEFPVLAAPMSMLGHVHPDGDLELVRATAAAGTIAIVSQYALAPLDDLVRASGNRLWVQHYPLADRGVDEAVVRAALDAGAGALVVTVDFPLRGVTRARPRSGFAFPSDDQFPTHAARGYEAATSITPDYFDGLRRITSVPIVAKGVLHPDDARRLADHGVTAVVVSNHGGRTLDGALPTADALGDVVAAVHEHMEVYVDGGIRSGADVLRALSLGARAVLVGRPLAWGLAYGGQQGVAHVLSRLRRELEEDAALAGVADTRAIPAGLVRRRTN